MAILDAGRNALSFFLLLVVSLGLSVVRESLGPVMTRVKLLAGAHFVFGGKSIQSGKNTLCQLVTSSVCDGNGGARTRERLCITFAHVRYPAQLHAVWIPALDHVRAEW